MFIVSALYRVSQLRRSGMLPKRIFADNISLLWSSCLWVAFRIYKHSAPSELKRLVAPGLSVPCGYVLRFKTAATNN